MYDYKFDFEEDSKIPCLCGATNCRKWMNWKARPHADCCSRAFSRAVMSILSFKLDFYMFVLSLSHSLYIFTYISLQPYFIWCHLLSFPPRKHCTFCREFYKYIYVCMHVCPYPQRPNTDSFVVVVDVVVILYSSVLPATIYYNWVLCVELHMFVCKTASIARTCFDDDGFVRTNN